MTFLDVPALTWAADPEYFSMHEMMWWGGWGMLFGPLMMIAYIAVIVIVVVLIIRWLGGAASADATPFSGSAVKTPLDILKERFARGEIDGNEFEERRRILSD